MIDWTKPVETDEKPPRPVRVLFDNDGEAQGFLIKNMYGETLIWSLDCGHAIRDGESAIRLRNVPPKPRIVMERRWVNVWAGTSAVNRSRELADDSQDAYGTRIACVEIDWPVAVTEP